MRRIWQLMVKEFLQIRQDKRMLPLILLAPVVQTILLGYAATVDVKNISLVVCNYDRGVESREILRRFENTGYFTIAGTVGNTSEIDRFLERGDARMGVIIPRNFSRDIASRTRASMQFIADGTDANTANIALSYAARIVGGYAGYVITEQVERSGRIVRIPQVAVETRVWFNPELRSVNFMVPGVVALILFIITAAFTSVAIVREKEVGTLEQLLVTPIRPYEFILGKLLPFVIIGFIDVALVLGIAVNWFDIPLKGSVVLLFALCGLFILTTLGIGLFVSTVSRTQQQALMTTQFFIMFPFIFLSGFAFPIENMPPVIQSITYLIPLRYFLTIIRGLFLKGVGIDTLWPQALALLTFGVAILSVSILRLKKKNG